MTEISHRGPVSGQYHALSTGISGPFHPKNDRTLPRFADFVALFGLLWVVSALRTSGMSRLAPVQFILRPFLTTTRVSVRNYPRFLGPIGPRPPRQAPDCHYGRVRSHCALSTFPSPGPGRGATKGVGVVRGSCWRTYRWRSCSGALVLVHERRACRSCSCISAHGGLRRTLLAPHWCSA